MKPVLFSFLPWLPGNSERDFLACIQECSLVRMGVTILYMVPLRACNSLRKFVCWCLRQVCLLNLLKVLSLAFSFGFGDNLQRNNFISDT